MGVGKGADIEKEGRPKAKLSLGVKQSQANQKSQIMKHKRKVRSKRAGKVKK